MKHIKFYILLIVICLACSKEDKISESDDKQPQSDELTLSESQFQLAAIEIAKTQQREINDIVKANGKLDVPPQNMVSISAPLGGFVKHTELLQGMKVKKGQVLVLMESPEYIQLQQDYLEAKSQLGFLEEEYFRQLELAKNNVNSTKTLQQAKSGYQSMKARKEGLKAKLKLIHIDAKTIEEGSIQNEISIPSPIDGFVTEVHVNLGSYVNPTDIMFEIIDTEHVHAEAEVFEKDVLKLKKGQRVFVRLANETEVREATVYLIGKEISPERTVRIHCHLEKEDIHLLPGMYFSAIIETGDQKVSSLPEEAFAAFEGKDYLFLVINKTKHQYKMIPVNKGNCQGGYCQVTIPQELDSDSEFVIKGVFQLLSQLKNAAEE